MSKEIKSQSISSPFVEYSISLKVGAHLLKPEDVTKELLLEKIKIHNTEKHLDFLTDFLNVEIIDVDKASLFYDVLLSLDSSIYEKMVNKTLYFNNPEFYLSPAAPSNLETFYENEISFDIASSANDLVFLSATFKNLSPLASSQLVEVEQFILDKNLEIEKIDAAVIEAENKEDYDSLSELYTQLRELKYARFSALKILKSNVDLIEDRKDFRLRDLNVLFDEYLVPPIH